MCITKEAGAFILQGKKKTKKKRYAKCKIIAIF